MEGIIMEEIEFRAWPKIHRLQRTVVVTEKLDGTNAAILITEDGRIAAQSRKRLITPEDDNYNFASWVHENKHELIATLGPGRHFGEWWGSGIQRRYDLPKGEKRFSLFNVKRWTSVGAANPHDLHRCIEAPLCYVVPIIYQGDGFDNVEPAIRMLNDLGSLASPGFKRPEGVVAFHVASQATFKVMCENDERHKFEQVDT